jgi:hypothetical protein
VTAPALEAPTALARPTLLSAYLAAAAQTRATVLALLTGQWATLDSWRDSDVAPFVASAAPILHAGEDHLDGLTRAYLAAMLDPEDTAPPAVPDVLDPARVRDVPDHELLSRPFKTTWRQLGRGDPLPDAVAAGRTRLTDIGATNLQLAKTTTARDVLARDTRVVGYRRVLTGPSSCARCVLASTQRYHKADLLPIHPGCDCAVAPLLRDADEDDPTQVIDAPAVEQLHEIIRADLGEKYVDAGGRGPIDYRGIIVTHQHGEIGPVLTVHGQAFRGPRDLAH